MRASTRKLPRVAAAGDGWVITRLPDGPNGAPSWSAWHQTGEFVTEVVYMLDGAPDEPPRLVSFRVYNPELGGGMLTARVLRRLAHLPPASMEGEMWRQEREEYERAAQQRADEGEMLRQRKGQDKKRPRGHAKGSEAQ